MKRRHFLRMTGTAGLFAAGCSTLVAKNETPKAIKRPNVLLLYTDDQTFQTIGALNNPEIKTPNIDKLVARGTTFTHAMNMGGWSGAICVAARAMLNTGRRVWDCQGQSAGNGRLPLFGEQFRKSGYNTFVTGKWHNGTVTLKKSFTHIGKTGGGMFGSTGMTGDAYLRPNPPKKDTWDPSDKSRSGHWRSVNGADGKKTIIHSSDLWANEANGFLKDVAAKSADPFLMYVAFHAPHDPRQSPKEYIDKYPVDKIAIPDNYKPLHPFNSGDMYIRDEILAPHPRTKKAVQQHRQEYYAIITHADAAIGRILKALDDSGKADETIVIFTGDHGLAVGRHGLIGKQNLYDHSVRVPLIFAGPGIPKGKKIDKQVYYQSLAPTMMEFCGIDVPKTVQFQSLRNLIDGKPGGYQGEKEAYLAYQIYQRALRGEKYKLIVYPYAGSKIVWTKNNNESRSHNKSACYPVKPYKARIQLFDIQTDPGELTNLADDPKFKTIRETMFAKLQAECTAHNDPIKDLRNPPEMKIGGKLHYGSNWDPRRIKPTHFAHAHPAK
ncbi:MAG: sulfatase-like hydrolase/transferase [Phycisphaerales bacterium]|jgi:arylsulfatase A-like enzyme|nr:sulfatase-like hydrolase/transferase [Phycisphaerales bacterium]MBT7171040.1 sulfatase-like hydrolase/transferase [Phycisphaerales bacterium]